MQIKLVLLVNYRENEYKLLAWRYLDHVSKQYRQWLPGYRRLLDTIRSTIRDHPRNRCTKSLYPFSLWLSSGLTIPRLRWKLAQNSSTITTKPLWLQTPYFKAFFPVLSTDIRLLLFDFFFQKSREGVYRFTTQTQLTSTSHRSSRNTSRGSSNLSVSNSIHVRLPRTQEWPSWYSSPWGKFPAACWSAESWKRNVQAKFKVTTRLELLEGTLADAWNYCPWAKGGIDQFSHSPRS